MKDLPDDTSKWPDWYYYMPKIGKWRPKKLTKNEQILKLQKENADLKKHIEYLEKNYEPRKMPKLIC